MSFRKRAIVPLLMCLAIAMVYGSEPRTFTDSQGREIEAKIVSFDERSGKVRLEREDGKTFEVPPGIFSDADQEYIQAWTAAHRMLSEDNLRISFKKLSEEADIKAYRYKSGLDGESVHYEVILENRSEQPIENLEIEYRYFITVDIKDRNSEEFTRTITRSKTVGGIEPFSKKSFATEAVTFGSKIRLVQIFDRGRSTEGYDERTISSEDLEGIWMKIRRQEDFGVPVTRDTCYPDRLQQREVWDNTISPRMEQAMELGKASFSELNSWVDMADTAISEEDDEAELRDISAATALLFDQVTVDSGTVLKLERLAAAYYYKGLYDLSVAWLQKAAKWHKFSFAMLAELYATVPSVCDGKKAVECAERMLEARDGHGSYSFTNEKGQRYKVVAPPWLQPAKDAWYADVLAGAYARDGQFKKAVKHQQEALSILATLPENMKERYQAAFEQRLALYEAGRPYDLNPSDPCCWVYVNDRASSSQGEKEESKTPYLLRRPSSFENKWLKQNGFVGAAN